MLSAFMLLRSIYLSVHDVGEVLADSEIEVAGRGAGSERELEMATSWLTSTVDSNLDLGSKSDLKAWDQFAYNEQRHGVVSSYSDELYTTKISDKQFTPEQLAMAERLAREIETKTSTNAHVLEERGQKDLDDGDMDEEEKYSMVLDPSRVETAAPSTEPAASIAAAEPAAEPLMAPSTEPSAPAEAPALSSWSTSAAPATKAPVFSKLRATASEFVPMRVQVVRPPTGPSPPQGAPPAPPQGVPPNGMYQMQGGMMQMQGGMPITPGGQGMPQQGMMMGHMSHEQAQHAAQQQQAAQAQQMAMMQQQQRAQMPPGANSMMMPMQGGLRPGMVVPTVMAPVGMGPQSMPAGPMMVQQGMMPPNMMPQHGMFPSGNARPVPPQQPMPPRMHGPHSGPGPRMMPQGGMQQGGYPQGGMPMGMRGQPSYSSGMGGYGGPQMQARPEG